MEKICTKDDSIELLNEIYKNVKMATQSLENVLTSIKLEDITVELSKESTEYNIFEKECIMIANSKDYNLKDNNIIQKTQLWVSIKLNMLASAYTQHIAEMLLIGTMMGIIDLVKAVTNYENADTEIMNLANKLIEYERNNIDTFFEYLKVKPKDKNQCEE